MLDETDRHHIRELVDTHGMRNIVQALAIISQEKQIGIQKSSFRGEAVDRQELHDWSKVEYTLWDALSEIPE